ncbi:hypothetical protein AN644_00655 [Candidatus Epulonipiscium fishelsonii]|nr:hypothetical protein AN644_00655 [Epulopiscium sp. SCG-C06WGA-EpuloA1]
MKMTDRIYDILLITDYKGRILKVVESKVRLNGFPKEGQNILDITDKSSRIKMIRFLYEVISYKKTKLWEQCFNIENVLHEVSVQAEILDEYSILIGIITTPYILHMYNEMMSMNNKYINELRMITKENTILSRSQMIYPNLNSDKSTEYINKSLEQMARNSLDILSEDQDLQDKTNTDFIKILKEGIVIWKGLLDFKNITVNIFKEEDTAIIPFNALDIRSIYLAALSIIIKFAQPSSNLDIYIKREQDSFLVEFNFVKDNLDEIFWKEQEINTLRIFLEQNNGTLWSCEDGNKRKLFNVIPSKQLPFVPALEFAL